ncbi:MAG TPA: PP2C family serine/threonine-protein phosphatase [Candidatus Dormibacteraeota bacterium]
MLEERTAATEIRWGLWPDPTTPAEARCLVLEPRPGGPGAHVLAVAEGLGGGGAGAAAAGATIDALARAATRLELERPRLWLRDAFAAATRAVRDHGAVGDAPLASTLTVLVLCGNQVLIGHVGDCRAHLLRDGAVEQCTTDHTRAAELVRLRQLTPEQAITHPARRLLTRCLGTRPPAAPDIVRRPMRPGDTWILCSAGMSGALDREGIRDAVRRRAPLDAAVGLVDLAGGGGAAVAGVSRAASAPSPEHRLWYARRHAVGPTHFTPHPPPSSKDR